MKLKLPEYIKKYGDNHCAKLWGEEERTVTSWRLRHRYPRVYKAQRIVNMTKGQKDKIDYEGIYGE